MSLLTIEVTSPKTQDAEGKARAITITVDVTEAEGNPELLQNAARRMWAQDAGNAARRLLNNPALTPEAVIAKMKSFKPGIAMPRQAGAAKDPVAAFSAAILTMTPEEMSVAMDKVKAAIAAKKAGK